MLELLASFGLGILLLLVSTKFLVKISEELSASLKISPLVVGLTVVAIGTSLPELAVSTIASARNDVGLAVGNIVGSNIVNILLVFGVGIMAGRLRVGMTKTQRNAGILLVVTAMFIVFQNKLAGNFGLGVALIASAVILTIAEFKWAIWGRNHEDAVKLKGLRRRKISWGAVFVLAAAMGGIVAGGFLTVVSLEEMSEITGYSTTFLGLTLSAVATSLPELLTTVFSQKEGLEKLTIGNIIGSNIYNLLFIGGVINLFSEKSGVRAGDWLMLALVSGSFFLIIRHYRGKVIPRATGLGLILLFVAYLATLSIFHP